MTLAERLEHTRARLEEARERAQATQWVYYRSAIEWYETLIEAMLADDNQLREMARGAPRTAFAVTIARDELGRSIT